jgi:hypothetical protein
MIRFIPKSLSLEFRFPRTQSKQVRNFIDKWTNPFITVTLITLSLKFFIYYYQNGLGLAYNDARSHLDIGRRVVEGLKPGLAQLGSVWLPLDHLLMLPFIWNDFLWHSGLAGAIQNMFGFVITGLVISKLLHELGVGTLGRIVGVAVFAANINVLYLQSTAMTELLLLATMTLGVYELVIWHKNDAILNLIKAAFWIMLSTLVRYDGWFLLLFAGALVFLRILLRRGYLTAEGIFILFMTLGSVGILFWFLWNQLIFKNALYFIFGPFSAYAQQTQMAQAGVLFTKHNWPLSLKIYTYALMYNTYTYPALLGILGAVMLWMDRRLSRGVRMASTALAAPFIFNVLALYLGFSVLYVQNISGNTWFNVRYGIMMMPSIAVFIGFLVDRLTSYRWVILLTLGMVLVSAFTNNDAVTIDDAKVGASQKNVSEVAQYLQEHASGERGFILISAASHDAIIFSSGLPMKRYIHEGTGKYWESAIESPDRWARWIVMRTYDVNDLTYKSIRKNTALKMYNFVANYPFADVYELKPEYLPNLQTEPVFPTQR